MQLLETTCSSGLRYELKCDNGEILREISITACTVEIEGQPVRLIYGSRLDPRDDMCRFFLKKYREAADNSVKQAMTAMKLLAAYEEIAGIPFEGFDEGDAESFLLFLRGACRRSTLISYELKTARSENTIGDYLKTYRKYAKFLGLANSPFLEKRQSVDGSTQYVISASDSESLEAPPHITPDEYLKVIDIIERSYGLMERCIVRLMFEHGLRIGEVLGLTIEDVVARKDRSGLMKYHILLRDRLSDTDDKRAKRVMKVRRESDYAKPGYKKRNAGYQRVSISESLYHELIVYMENAHGHAAGNVASRREATARADNVSGPEDNYYLFLNSLGRPLRDDAWNKKVRAIFLEAGIPVDSGVRRNGLNHRFRHGFAMVLKHVLKLDDYAIMVLMRHRSLLSTQAYDNPTPDQIAEMQEDVIERWAEEVIPCMYR